MKYLILLSILVSLPAAAEWSTPGRVIELIAREGQRFVLTNINENPCGQAGKFWWNTTDAEAEDMFAMSLAAMRERHSKPNVRFFYDAVSPACDTGGVQVTRMRIRW